MLASRLLLAKAKCHHEKLHKCRFNSGLNKVAGDLSHYVCTVAKPGVRLRTQVLYLAFL